MNRPDKPITILTQPPPCSLEEDAEMLADSIFAELNLADTLNDLDALDAHDDTCVISIGPSFSDISKESFNAQRVETLRRRIAQGDYTLDHKAIANALITKTRTFA